MAFRLPNIGNSELAQFDVFTTADEGDLVVDCQSHLLRHLNTRFVAPLMPLDRAPTPAGRLNPLFEIEGRRLSMVTQFAGSMPATELVQPVCSLSDRRHEIIGALDMLITGV
jgi:toxin CcdB